MVIPKEGGSIVKLPQEIGGVPFCVIRGGLDVVEPAFSLHDKDQLRLDLLSALNSGQLVVHYQPKVNLLSGELVGLEALVRWDHPRLGLLSPEHFIPLAEREGFIGSLTRLVFRSVIQQGAAWQQGHCLVPISINLSAFDLEDSALPGYVDGLLHEWGLSGSFLEIEITESHAIGDWGKCAALLRHFGSLGISVAIDDFGTGYASWSYLKEFPVDTIKIDKSFVMDMARDHTNSIIVQSIVHLGHRLGKRVVAEGVDSQENWDMLLLSSCDQAQGFHISQPLSTEAVTLWLRQENRIYMEGLL
jgi:EAL domain-containing protein (putative c-di-GMP-specific phosphodiesterase class I)